MNVFISSVITGYEHFRDAAADAIHVLHKVGQALRFSGWLLSEIGPVSRLSDVVIAAGLTGANYMGWQTRAEATTSGGSVRLGAGGERVEVRLSPPRRNRGALLMDWARITRPAVFTPSD